MKEALYSALWRWALQARNAAKGAGLLGAFEQIVLFLGPRLVRPPSAEVVVTVHGQMGMAIPPGVAVARSFQAGLYEPDVTAAFYRVIAGGMTILDIGASIGYYTLLASKLVGASGRVWAFEPDAQAYAYLVRNIQANDCRNVTAVKKGVADRVGRASLMGSEPERRFISADSRDSNGAAVETLALDTVLAELVPVDVMKMDIEGGEPAALRGMREMSAASPNLRLIMEWCTPFLKRSGATPESVAELLRQLGFVSYEVLERNAGSVPLAHGLPKGRAVYNLLLSKQ